MGTYIEKAFDELGWTIPLEQPLSGSEQSAVGLAARLMEERDNLRAEFDRINVRNPELMAKVRDYANSEHGLVVDMQDGTGRTGLYVETGFLRLLLARNEELETRLRISTQALDDWTSTYASEFCNDARVKEAWQRITDGGGTLYYIASIVSVNHALLRGEHIQGGAVAEQQIAVHCPACPAWDEYVDDGCEASGKREPNNCSRWLCNSGGCPHDRKPWPSGILPAMLSELGEDDPKISSSRTQAAREE